MWLVYSNEGLEARFNFYSQAMNYVKSLAQIGAKAWIKGYILYGT